MREEWERMRWMVWQLSIPHFKKGRAPQTAQAFLRFPWERQTAEEVEKKVKEGGLTAGQIAELNRIMSDYNSRHKKS